MSKWASLKTLAARKAIHVAFVALLAVPFLVDVSAELYISLLVVASGFIYSIQVRQPAAWVEFRRNMFKTFEDLFNRLEQLIPIERPELRLQYQRALRQLEELIDMAERDYEKRHGYLGVLMGGVGFLAALTLFGRQHLLAAIVSMAVYDTVSAVVGTAVGGRKIGRITVAGTLAGALANVVALMAAGYPPLAALAITALVVAADATSPEDNLTIPVAAAAGSYLSGLLPR